MVGTAKQTLPLPPGANRAPQAPARCLHTRHDGHRRSGTTKTACNSLPRRDSLKSSPAKDNVGTKRTCCTLPGGGRSSILLHLKETSLAKESQGGLRQFCAFGDLTQPQGAAQPSSSPPAQYLSEEGSVEGDGVEAVDRPHGDIQVHQQPLLLLRVHSRSNPLRQTYNKEKKRGLMKVEFCSQ